MLTYIIDDESISLFLTEQVLRNEGVNFPIHSFLKAEQALSYLLDHLHTEIPEVIFLDLNMPLMSGWDFLDALAPYAAALAGRCRIYILTSSLALADTTRADSHPLVTGIIHKPICEEEVQSICQAVGQPQPSPGKGQQTTNQRV